MCTHGSEICQARTRNLKIQNDYLLPVKWCTCMKFVLTQDANFFWKFCIYLFYAILKFCIHV